MCADEFANAAFMCIADIGVEQTHRDAPHPQLGQLGYGKQDGIFIELFQLAPHMVHPARSFAYEMQWHETRRLDPEQGVAVAVGHRLAGNFDEVAKSPRDDQPETFELVLENRVGCSRGAVQHQADIRRRALRHVEDSGDTVQEPDAGIVRCARCLDDELAAVRFVDGHYVGECPASVDRNPQSHFHTTRSSREVE